MNREQAQSALSSEVARLRQESYSDLVSRLPDNPATIERTASDGTRYQVELQAFWDDHPGGNLRVLASVDDGGWRAFAPLSDDFIKAPDGSFVGE